MDSFPVESVQIMMFAKAIGDDNPVYHDAGSPHTIAMGGIVAPPTFVMAGAQFDARLPNRMGSQTVSSVANSELAAQSQRSGSLLHAEQTFEYHKAVQPGMVLHSILREGDSWEKKSRRGGLLKFQEAVIEYRDGGGELVVTARRVSVVTEPPVGLEEHDG
jgi:hypothetical protein